MGGIFNKNGVPHLSTLNSFATVRPTEHIANSRGPEVSIDVNNTGEGTKEQTCEDDHETVKERIRGYNKQLNDYFRESGKRLDRIQEELNELSIYLGLDCESDSDSGSGGQYAGNERLKPFPSGDCASTELICLADCYNLPSYEPGQEDIDRTSGPTYEHTPRTWSGPDPNSTSPLDAFFKHYFLSDRTKRNNWIPSRKKTKEPIILYGATDINEIHTTAKRVKGLHTCSAGAPPNRVVVLGWDRLAVWLRASEFSASSYSADVCRYIFDTARRFAKAMNGDRVGLRLNKAENWTDNALEGILDHFQGSYLVRWKVVGGGWDVRAVLGLDIGMGPRKNILEATIRFPGAEEKMLLAHKEKTLNAYLDGSLKEKEEAGDTDEYKASGNGARGVGGKGDDRKDEEADNTKSENFGDANEEKNAKPNSNEEEEPVDKPERGTMENPISSAAGGESQKPPRGTMGNPHEFAFIAELCFRVVGRSTEGCRGRIHWTADQAFTSFTGDGFLPYLSGRVEMEGWEI